MTALSFVWVHPYSQNSRCDITNWVTTRSTILGQRGATRDKSTGTEV